MSHPAGPPPSTEETSSRPSIGALLGDVSKDISDLMRQELALAKAEASQSAKRAGKGAGMLAGAGVAGHFVLLFLSIALWWWLGNLVTRGFAGVIVAVIWAIIAAILMARGRKELKATPGMDQTTDTLKKIPNAVKGHEEMNS